MTNRLLTPLLLALATLALAASPACALRGHAFLQAFGGKGSGAGQFEEPSDVAVNDAVGQVYVLDQGNSRIEIFNAKEEYESQFDGSATPAKAFAFGTVPLTGAIAVDDSCYFKKLSGGACTAADPSNGDVYVTDPGNRVVDKFSASGAYLGQLRQASGGAVFTFPELRDELEQGLEGVAVDTDGVVLADYDAHVSGDVASFSNGEPSTLISSRNLLNETGVGFNRFGFAVDSEHNVYARKGGFGSAFLVDKFSGGGQAPEALSALMVPFVNEETSAVAVDLATNEVFLDNVGSIGAFSSTGVTQERFGAEEGLKHLTAGAGVAVAHENSTDSTVYVADTTTDVVDVFGPEPPGPPAMVVGSTSVSSVTGDSATFQVEVNPHGASTDYHFEYGPCASTSACATSAYGESVPVSDGVVGSDFEVHVVSAHPQDLQPGTVYHFRVVAHNEHVPAGSAVEGEEVVFRTQTVGPFALPDDRSWELVSPPDKHGALIEPIFGQVQGGPVQASVSGDAITYTTSSPSELEPDGNSLAGQVLSMRTVSGWGSRDIAIPHSAATGTRLGNGSEYRFFSSDLGLSVVQPFGVFDPELSPQASEQTAFLHADYQPGHPGEPCSQSCFTPLVIGCPTEGEECSSQVQAAENVPAGTRFGQEGKCPTKIAVCGPRFVGATPDLSHVVIDSEAALTEGPSAPAKDSLYEWTAGKLSLISVLPASGEGGASVAGVLGQGSGGVTQGARHAISPDGSRVVWKSISAEPHLYLRDMTSGAGETVRLDPGLKGKPEFQLANTDVSKVYFTDSGDLYEYDVEGRQLVRLTENANIGEGVLGASEDASYVYFTAGGVLAPGAVPGECFEAARFETTCNLYVLHNGTIKLVIVLSGADAADWAEFAGLSRQTARVSPDGRWLAFMSQRSLTGYDNRDAFSGKPDEEVYLYDAEHERVLCASCDPTGSRPSGVEYEQLAGIGHKSLVIASGEWDKGQWLAATIPGWTPYTGASSLYQSRYLSNTGRLFFNSHDPLAPRDVNGTWDVYEYEPPGVGTCTTSAVTYSESSQGCVSPISSGDSSEESAFLDASETGGDVFFLTAAHLSTLDTDTSLDVYDAHECPTAAPCQPAAGSVPPPCTNEASCRAAPTPQPTIFAAPASATFTGADNPAGLGAQSLKPRSLTRAQKLARALRVCARKPRDKRAACVKRARRSYGPLGKKQTKSNRRVG
jgi:hypothetical protein